MGVQGRHFGADGSVKVGLLRNTDWEISVEAAS